MANNRTALLLASLALLLSIIALVIIIRNPFTQIKRDACDREQVNCNSQCDIQRSLALGQIRLDSSLQVIQRNQDLLACRLDNIGHPDVIATCQQQVNDHFANVMQAFRQRRRQVESQHTDCIALCTAKHDTCYANIPSGPTLAGNTDATPCESSATACTISVPGPCTSTDIEIVVTCEELDCMGIPCHGDPPGLPVCVQPGPIEDGFNMDYKIVDEHGKKIDQFPALTTDPNCKFSLRHDKETIARLKKYQTNQIHLLITSKSKAPLTIKFEKSK